MSCASWLWEYLYFSDLSRRGNPSQLCVAWEWLCTDWPKALVFQAGFCRVCSLSGPTL